MTSSVTSGHKIPVTMAVVTAVAVVSLLAAVILAIGGSYLLTLRAINAQKAYAAAQASAQLKASIAASVPECQQLQSMDAAGAGATFTPGSYGQKLATSIHNFYVASKCDILLKDVAAHKTPDQIAKDLGQ